MELAERNQMIADFGKGLLRTNETLRTIAETLAYARDTMAEDQIDMAAAIFLRLSQAGHLRDPR